MVPYGFSAPEGGRSSPPGFVDPEPPRERDPRAARGRRFGADDGQCGKRFGFVANQCGIEAFLALLERGDACYPEGKGHLVCDHLAEHVGEEVAEWLEA